MWRESDVDEGTNEAAENLFTDDLSLNYRNMPHMDLDSIIRLHTDEIASCKSVLGDRHGVTIALSRSFAKVLKSRSCYREALAVLAETFSSVNHVPTACKIELEMALLNRHLGNKVLAEKQAAEVVTNLEHMFGPKHSFTLSAGSCLASIWNDLGRLDDAETLLHRLLLDKTERFGPEHPSTVKTSGTLAAVYYNKKRYTEAESLQIEILRHCERSFGSDHEFTWARRLNLAAIYTKLNRFEEAERIESQVLEYRRIKLGPKHDLYLTALSNLAFTYRLQKEWTKEETALCEVVSGRLEVLGSGHSDTMTSVQALANNCLSRRAPTQAAPLFQKLVEVKSQKSDLGPTHPSTLASRNSLAWAYFDQGKQVEARSMQRQTVEDGDIALGFSHPAAIHCKRHYAMMLKASGRLEDSMQIFREVLHVQVQGQGDPVVNDMQDTLRRISELEGLIEKAEDVQ
jgi:tetratricopeptide (TPR) repeat protein